MTCRRAGTLPDRPPARRLPTRVLMFLLPSGAISTLDPNPLMARRNRAATIHGSQVSSYSIHSTH